MYKTDISIFLNRIRRVCLLDSDVYHGAAQSFLSAIIIVLLVAFSHGVGGVIRANFNRWNTLESFVFGFQGEILFWLIQSLVYYAIAKWIISIPVKLKEVFSIVGFAIAPGFFVLVAAILQPFEMTIPLLIILVVYRLLTCTLALQKLLRLKLLNAIIIVIVDTAVGFFSLGFGIRLTEALIK
jgi:hypothetical protein